MPQSIATLKGFKNIIKVYKDRGFRKSKGKSNEKSNPTSRAAETERSSILPDELVLKILEFLDEDTQSISRLGLVSKSMHAIIQPALFTKFRVFPDRKYTWKRIPCYLIQHLHVVVQAQPRKAPLRNALANWDNRVPSLFHPPSSPIPWILFTNLKSLVVAPLGNSALYSLGCPILPGRGDIPANTSSSPDPRRRKLSGMLPKGSSVTHLTYSTMPYIFLFFGTHRIRDARSKWDTPLPRVTHFQLQYQYAHQDGQDSPCWSLWCKLSTWNLGIIHLDWIKGVFPSLQVFVLPLMVLHDSVANQDSVSHVESPILFQRFVRRIFKELPKIRLIAFVVVSYKFNTHEVVMEGVEGWVRALPKPLGERTVVVKDMRGDGFVHQYQGVEDIWVRVEQAVREREEAAQND